MEKLQIVMNIGIGIRLSKTFAMIVAFSHVLISNLANFALLLAFLGLDAIDYIPLTDIGIHVRDSDWKYRYNRRNILWCLKICIYVVSSIPSEVKGSFLLSTLLLFR